MSRRDLHRSARPLSPRPCSPENSRQAPRTGEAAAAPKREPRQILQHLLAEHGLNAADLSRILGASRTLGAMILREERSLTIEHARVLVRHFGLPVSVFIE